jgi:endonuclease/exonuclease/phosphatase family metal-dependent hydrolase
MSRIAFWERRMTNTEQMTKLALIVLAILFFITGPFTNVPASGNELKVMTINVWSGLTYDGTFSMGYYDTDEFREKRFVSLVAEIKDLKPDVIAVNEANYLPGYVKRLAKELDYSYIYHVGVSGLKIFRVGIPVNLREGDTILARKGLLLEQAGHMQLSGGPVCNSASFHTTDATQVLIGKIVSGGKAVFIAATHLHSSVPDNEQTMEIAGKIKHQSGYTDEEYREFLASITSENKWREMEMKKLIAYLDKKIPEGAPLILLGDFNTGMDSPEIYELLKAGFYDTYSLMNTDGGFTWDAGLNDNIKRFYLPGSDKKQKTLYKHVDNYTSVIDRKRIDFIFAGNDILYDSVISSQVVCNKGYDGVMPSDHFGVMTVFEIQ